MENKKPEETQQIQASPETMQAVGVLNLRINDMMTQLNVVIQCFAKENNALKKENEKLKQENAKLAPIKPKQR